MAARGRGRKTIGKSTKVVQVDPRLQKINNKYNNEVKSANNKFNEKIEELAQKFKAKKITYEKFEALGDKAGQKCLKEKDAALKNVNKAKKKLGL